jgi:hypothetical protein
MDHILEPLLAEEAFRSEVCHINHRGENGGLIYEEVQSRESLCEDMCLSALLQRLFPDDNSGYSSMPSGRSENIRHLKIDSVRDFHRHFYTLRNMQLVVSGSVNKQKVLDELHQHSVASYRKGQQGDTAAHPDVPFERPWSTPLSPPAESATITIDFPANVSASSSEKTDGSGSSGGVNGEPCGMVLIGWRGPEWSHFEDILKIRLMWKYLINSPSSPLKKIFLGEGENGGGVQLCKHISVVFTPQSICCHHVRFYGVPVSLLHIIAPVFFHAIAVICSATSPTPKIGADRTARTRSPKSRSSRYHESSSISLSQSALQLALEAQAADQASSAEDKGKKKKTTDRTVPREIALHLLPTAAFFAKLCAKEKRRCNGGGGGGGGGCGGNTGGVTSLEEACHRGDFDDSLGVRQCHIIQRLRALEATLSRDKGIVGGVDMEQLSTVVVQEKLRQKMIWEDDRVHSHVQTPQLIGKIISHFLYGDRFSEAIEQQQLGDCLNSHEMLDTLPQACDEASKEHWQDLMFEHLLCSHHPESGSGPVCVIGRPSVDAFHQRTQQDAACADKNRESHDVPWEARQLEAAYEYLASEALFLPADTLYQMPLHSPDGATYFPLVSIRSTPALALPSSSSSALSDHRDRGSDGSAEVETHTAIQLLTKGAPVDVEGEHEANSVIDTSSGDEVLAFFYAKGLVQEAGVGPPNAQLPFLIQWSQIPSHFLDICVAIETSHLPASLRPYLQLFTETLLECSVTLDDGSRLRAADVKELRAKDLISTYCKLGIGGNLLSCGEFAQAVVLTFRVEREKYELGVEWLRRTLFHADVVSDDRVIEQGCHQILKAVSASQSDGLSLCTQVVHGELFDTDTCNHCASSILSQNAFIRQVLARLEVDREMYNSKLSSSVQSVGSSVSDVSTPSSSDGSDEVLRDLTRVQEILMAPANLKVLVVGDVMSQEDPVRPWIRGFLPPPSTSSNASSPPSTSNNNNTGHPGSSSSSSHATESLRIDTQSPVGVGGAEARSSGSRGVTSSLIRPTSSLTATGAHAESEFHSVVSVPFLDHCAMVQAAPGPKSFDDPSLPALLVAIDVVTAQASRTRSESDTYHFAANQFRSAVITCRPEQGFVFLQITDRDNIHEFYETLFGIVCALVEVQCCSLLSTLLSFSSRHVPFDPLAF